MDEEELKQSTTTPLTFEFTKRKRWAETVINELVDVAILVFSQTGLILHCDASIHEVMGPGYSEDQIVNKNFRDLLHGDDIELFFNAFNDSIVSNKELTSYVRIRSSDARLGDKKSRLVEVKANPAYDNNECLCVFAMLTPYPSSNVKHLDDYMVLTLENEQLAHRIAAWKRGEISEEDESLLSDPDVPESVFEKSAQENIVDRADRAIDKLSATLAASVSTQAPTTTPTISPTVPATPYGDGADNGLPQKKKRKVAGSSEQRICTSCGSNNSPEWRKGPQGAKTLCNACGLRWAKKTKGTAKDENEE